MNSTPFKLMAWISVGLILLAIGTSISMAYQRRMVLKQITVTYLGEEEHRDHSIPLYKRKEALPDYTIELQHTDRGTVKLDTHLDQSALEGLTWTLSELYSCKDIPTIRLYDEDKIISEDLAEIAFDGQPVTENDYQFEFELETSFETGLASFWKTPVGTAIIWAFGALVLLFLLSLLAPIMIHKMD